MSLSLTWCKEDAAESTSATRSLCYAKLGSYLSDNDWCRRVYHYVGHQVKTSDKSVTSKRLTFKYTFKFLLGNNFTSM